MFFLDGSKIIFIFATSSAFFDVNINSCLVNCYLFLHCVVDDKHDEKDAEMAFYLRRIGTSQILVISSQDKTVVGVPCCAYTFLYIVTAWVRHCLSQTDW